jgi:hypothetical protein
MIPCTAGLPPFILAFPLVSISIPSAEVEIETREVQELVTVDLVHNGDFAESAPAGTPIPWWRSTRGMAQLQTVDDVVTVVTGDGVIAEQPIGVYEGALDALRISFRLRGSGILKITDGRGVVAELPFGGADGMASYQVNPEALIQAFGGAPQPRLLLTLTSVDLAYWTDVVVTTELPAPSVSELRALCIEELHWIISLWLDRAVADEGPAFPRSLFDVVTGDRLDFVLDGGHNAWSEVLVRAAAQDPRWRSQADRLVEDWLTLATNPTTGLPCGWSVEKNERIDRVAEVHSALSFLQDLGEGAFGLSEDVQRRAKDIAALAFASIAREGPRPDGEIAAAYHSGDGRAIPDVSDLRRLHVPALLARHAASQGDEAGLRLARQAVAAFLYTHLWVGEWHEIDPGFDDRFGNYGACGVELWRAAPKDKYLAHITRSGIKYFLPRWHDALRFGGNIAADQVRCWKLMLEACELDPSIRTELAPVLRSAVHAHLAGQQYSDGAWGDVTFKHADPRTELEVGDLIGTPQNLLEGLALLHDARLEGAGGLPLALVRAHFLAVLETSRAHYKRDFGYLSSREENPGDDMPRASLGVAVALLTLLERLPE